jgi:hypothetical protein
MTTAPPGLKPALIVFFLALFGGSILAIFLEAIVPGSAGPLGFVIAFSSAAWAGQVFVEKNDRRPDRREHLCFSVVTGLAPILLAAVLVLGMLIYLKLVLRLDDTDLAQGLLSRDKWNFLALAAAIATPLSIAVSWFGFSFGVRSGEKQRAKRAAK